MENETINLFLFLSAMAMTLDEDEETEQARILLMDSCWDSYESAYLKGWDNAVANKPVVSMTLTPQEQKAKSLLS